MTTLIGLAAGIVGAVLGYFIRYRIGQLAAGTSEQQARQALADARREADSIVKDGRIKIKEEQLAAREEFERSTDERRKELVALTERIAQRETNLDRKVSLLDKKEQAIEERAARVAQRETGLEAESAKLEKLIAQALDKLQRVAGMTRDQARESLLAGLQKEVQGEIGGMIRRMQEEAKATAEREAKRLIALAIQRFAASHTSELVTSTVVLPSDDIKGRIIGREGRNIRALEAATGINILIDDTPEAVVLSGFDPVRREVAKLALENLVADGRIHPARIEEVVEKTRLEMDETIRKVGEETVYELGLQGVDPEVIATLGRLKYRRSYAQNVLRHSVEVAQLMALMAVELGLDADVAKRVGLFHDLGKAIDHEVEGGHALIGADMLRRTGESPEVVNAVAAHHEDVEAESLYAVLCSAADAISSSRVGARSETSEIYIKRLEKLEEITNSFEGVTQSYAIQAGREVRVLVKPETINDGQAMVMARDMARKIEADLKYPGQIRVTVIRETRCVEYAK